MDRFSQSDSIHFEVTQVKIRKITQYGEPFSAIGTLDFYHDTCFISGVLYRDNDQVNSTDFALFEQYARTMNCKKFNMYATKRERKIVRETINTIGLAARTLFAYIVLGLLLALPALPFYRLLNGQTGAITVG